MFVCSTHRYYSLIGLIVSTARTMYPGWRIRIYHNVTRENKEVLHSSHFTTEASLKAGVGKILRLLLHRGHSWSLWREFFTCYGQMELAKTTWNVLEDASKNQLNNKLVQKIATKTISPPHICLKSKIACKCSHLEIQLSWSSSQGTWTAI